mmetsp:Transcript_34579/g.99260  ORF Transcript_34579/g.99260 Transcript_34579/m.99260 type:complete len:203 (-) Transcript_34579:833-1441(-)
MRLQGEQEGHLAGAAAEAAGEEVAHHVPGHRRGGPGPHPRRAGAASRPLQLHLRRLAPGHRPREHRPDRRGRVPALLGSPRLPAQVEREEAVPDAFGPPLPARDDPRRSTVAADRRVTTRACSHLGWYQPSSEEVCFGPGRLCGAVEQGVSGQVGRYLPTLGHTVVQPVAVAGPDAVLTVEIAVAIPHAHPQPLRQPGPERT